MRHLLAALAVAVLAACSGSTGTTAASTGGDTATTGGTTTGTSSGTTTGAPTSFTDPRDNQTYPIVTLGTQSWLGANMNWIPDGGGPSWCYGNKSSNCDSDGRLYTFNAAKLVCPSGWHLASDDEWETLETTLGMASNQLDAGGEISPRGTDEGTKLQATGDGDFAAKAAGYGSGVPPTFANPQDGYFWTSTVDAKNGNQIWRRHIAIGSPYLYRFENPPSSFAISVRCLQDSSN